MALFFLERERWYVGTKYLSKDDIEVKGVQHHCLADLFLVLDGKNNAEPNIPNRKFKLEYGYASRMQITDEKWEVPFHCVQ